MSALRRVVPAEIRDYFRLIDERLTKPTRLLVIGGAAVALGWDEHHATPDVDLFNHPGLEFLEAVAACRNLPGAIPISTVGIASPPYDFEDRLTLVPIDGLQFLRVFIPEAHDLALLKLVRGEAHDLDAIEDMHRVAPFTLDALLARYHETRHTLIGPERRLRTSFLALVTRLFGEDCADALQQRVDAVP
jgi:hypothetical protein